MAVSIPQRESTEPVNRVAEYLDRTPVKTLEKPVPARKFNLAATAVWMLRMVILVPLLVGAGALICSALIPAVFVGMVLLLVGLAPIIAVAVIFLLTEDIEAGRESHSEDFPGGEPFPF